MLFSNPRFLNQLATLMVTVVLLVGLAGVGYRFINAPMFTIHRVVIEPKQGEKLNYVSPASMQTTLASLPSANFFTLDLHQVQEVAETSPWVRHVDVTRLWPDGLLLRIEEYEPFALWNDNAMIDTWGEVFVANRGDYAGENDLPVFTGPDGSESLVVQRYAELMRWLAPLKLTVKELHLNDRYAWSIVLNTGMEIIMGRDPGAEAASPYDRQGAGDFASTIERFVQVWPVLSKRIDVNTVSKVDLRYTKGLALTFKKPPVAEPDQTEKK